MIDIIIPVYNAHDDLKTCLNSLKTTKNRTQWRAIVINDASPDGRVQDLIRDLESDSRFITMQNPVNLGFVKTVNRGLEVSKHDVVILNSDTIVYNGWLDRLSFHGALDDTATVTPFSNNATLASFPDTDSEHNSMLGITGEAINDILWDANKEQSIEIPTGVGFCMYISRLTLDTIGLFDADTFGKGYGEENDFCLRASKAGLKNLLACDVYVKHTGGASFQAEKQMLLNDAMEKIRQLYPTYERTVHEFISVDPPREARIRALIKLSATSERPTVLHIAHNHAGGTFKHIRDLGKQCEHQANHWILRALGGSKVRLEWATAGSTFVDVDTKNDQGFLDKLLDTLNICRIHVHHIASLPKVIVDYISNSGVEYDVTLHDFYFIGANPTLTNIHAEYHIDDDTKPKHITPFDKDKLEQWQAKQSTFLKAASRVISPSQACIDLYKKFYPEVKYLKVPHSEPTPTQIPLKPLKIGSNKTRKVLVIGALNKEKGADLLEDVAMRLAGHEYEFTLLGYAYRNLHNSVRTLGPYNNADLDHLISQENPDIIWFTARWPETFSYTLSAAIRSGRPILAPYLGVFPERLQSYPLSQTYCLNSSVDEIIDALKEDRGYFKDSQTPHEAFIPEVSAHFYEKKYIQAIPNKSVKGQKHISDVFEGLSSRIRPSLSLREKVLSVGLGLKRFKLFRLVLNCVPLHLKLFVVKRFTQRNLLDISR